MTLDGGDTIKDNTAAGFGTSGGFGGAMVVFGGRATVERSLCAQGNKAAKTGGFANVRVGGQLFFDANAQVDLGLNSPDTIAIDSIGNDVRCGSESSPA